MIDKHIIARLIQTDQPTILEIGSNEGTDTEDFLRVFPRGNLYCFEPDPRARKVFKKKIPCRRCRLYEYAVSDTDGTAMMYISDGAPPSSRNHHWNQSSSLKKPKLHRRVYPWCTFPRVRTVRTIRLDTWATSAHIRQIDFLWADVQGAERELIHGGIETLTKKTKFFYTEFENQELYEGEPNLREIQQMLPKFRLIGVYGNNALFRNTAIMRTDIVTYFWEYIKEKFRGPDGKLPFR